MIGQKISHYRIDAQLGRGGMGVVYRAHDERLRRDVALKVLPQEIASQEERRARILTEARAASALNHPGITTIYEVGEENEHLFLVMELVTGKTLRAMVKEGALEPRVVARLSIQMAEALGAAHAQGVVHGDIKPENISVTPEGRVKLLDFGIARQAAEQTLTKSRTSPATEEEVDSNSQITGTLAYMAPELLRGQSADARTDLFALGVTLYEMAAGHRPFPGPTPTALAGQILREKQIPLERAVAHAPAALARIVQRLLEKLPEERYPSARELQADLTNLLRELEIGPALAAAAAGKRSVAVLPFALLTPNPEDEYLGVALADAVINQLSAGGELLVRPTSTVMRYSKQSVDPLLAARELNVQVIVDGSIQRFGQRLRVHAQAWKASEGTSLISVKQDSEISDLFGLQDKIAEALARTLGVRESGAEPAEQAPTTKNPVAYELYLRATERLTHGSRWDTRTAIEMLENATKIDPRFAGAWARLAEACRLMAIMFEPIPSRFAPKPGWIGRAERAVGRALALDRDNAEAQCVRGLVLWSAAKGFQNRAALRALSNALGLNPGSHQALTWQGCIFFHVGLYEEAKEGLTEALVTNPDDAFTLVFLAQNSLYRGDYEEAREYNLRALAVDPANLWANLFSPSDLLYSGQLDRAAERIRDSMQVFPADPLLIACEALLWAKRGEARKAEQIVQRALTGGGGLSHSHHTLHNAASTYALLGKAAKAVSLLRKANQTGLPNYPLFRDDPHFAAIRKHPAFVKLLAGMKKEWENFKKEFGGSN